MKKAHLLGSVTLLSTLLLADAGVAREKWVMTRNGGTTGGHFATVTQTNTTEADGTLRHDLLGSGSGTSTCLWSSYSYSTPGTDAALNAIANGTYSGYMSIIVDCPNCTVSWSSSHLGQATIEEIHN